ncbi:MAG: carboxylesterase family protein [Minicystis sp.]
MQRRLFAAAGLALGLLSIAGAGVAQQGRGPGAAPALPGGEPGPTLALHQGKIQGLISEGSIVYRGIPYAKPPVGDLRWRSPQPAASWTGVRDGSKAGSSCAAALDCLYLNVHTPLDAKPGQKLPVMFWIHGGAFTGGTGSTFDGASFARKGVVVVTINYRLGNEGFYAHPALTRENEEDKGNYGIQDMIAALEWTKANIGAFGGDPNQITVFGESAGAIASYYLTYSPEAKGLFQKAISESGFPRYDGQPLAEAEKTGLANAEKAGVTGDGPAALKALRALPFNAMPPLSSRHDLGRTRPIIDGKTIPMRIMDAYAQGKEMKIPFMMGGNSNEASLLPTSNPQARIDAAVNKPVPYTGAPMTIANAMVTAEQVLEPNRAAARLHLQSGAPVYYYYFSFVTPAQRATSPGAPHGGELGYVFDSLRPGAAAEDHSIAQSMNAYWTAFAKYGNPGAAGGPAWPAFKPGDEGYMEFSSLGPRTGKDLQKAGLDWAEKELKPDGIAWRVQF